MIYKEVSVVTLTDSTVCQAGYLDDEWRVCSELKICVLAVLVIISELVTVLLNSGRQSTKRTNK